MVGQLGGVHKVAQFPLVHGSGDDKPGNGAQESQVKRPVMGRSVFSHQTRAVKAEHHRQFLQGHVVDNLVVGTLGERRIDIAERHHALRRQSGGKGNGVLFGDAHVEHPFRHLLHHHVERASRRHGGRDAYDAWIGFGQFDDGFSENVLIFGREAQIDARRNELARPHIEFSGRVVKGGGFFGFFQAFPFLGNDMQQLGALNGLEVLQHFHQGMQVVPVDRAEITEIQGFKKIARLRGNHRFDGARNLADETFGVVGARVAAHHIPYAVLEMVVRF